MKTTFAALALVILASASSFAQTADWKRLEGQNSGVRTRTVMAVKDVAAWRKVWTQHKPDTAVPAVNFETESVVVVFLGETRTAGVKVEITVQQDSLSANRVNVFYREVRPAKTGFAATVITYPFAMVKLAKADTVAIEADGAVNIPESHRAPENPADARKMRALVGMLAVPSFDQR